MKKKNILILAILCSIIFTSSSPVFADHWAYCTVDKAGISTVSGNVYVFLTHVSGSSSWEGSRYFRVNPENANASLAILLTAQTNNTQVHVKLSDITEGSIVYSIYIIPSS